MPDKIEIKYTTPDYYRPIYVNGAFGGFSPQGELVINFYFENTSIPESQTFDLTDEGRLSSNPVESKPERTEIPQIMRNIQTGIILDLASAKRISQWLNDKIEKFEEAKKGGKNGE